MNRKGIYFIWMSLKSRKAELKKKGKVSLGQYLGMFRHDVGRYDIRFIYTNTKPELPRIRAFHTLH